MEYVRGKVVFKDDDFIILETRNREGIKITTCACDLYELDREYRVFIHLEVKIDRNNLITHRFGFLNLYSLELFSFFMHVKGIGPKIALKILNTPAHTLLDAIINKDLLKLMSIPGIGKYSDVILELSEKAVHKSMLTNLYKRNSSEKEIKKFEIIRLLEDMGLDMKVLEKTLDEIEDIENKDESEIIKEVLAKNSLINNGKGE